ncbi:MAG: sigma-70 family RNA polymerase sigma factor [Oscillospiraceae bacterium]
MFSTILGSILAGMLFFALHLESRVLPKPLTEKQEREEFAKFSEGDKLARDTLIKHNLRLVAHVAKKYYQSGIESEDLISIGTIGLIKAVQSFSYDKNTRFSTYASKCIENEILMSFRKQKQNENMTSLDDTIEVNNDQSQLTLKDSLQDDFELEAYCEKQESKNEILNLIAGSLSARERQIIIMRYGIGGNPTLTQQQVCEVLNISRSYVSRLEKKALMKLRAEFEKDEK